MNKNKDYRELVKLYESIILKSSKPFPKYRKGTMTSAIAKEITIMKMTDFKKVNNDQSSMQNE